MVAQTDLGAWTGIKIHAPLISKWNAGLEAQSRFENYLSETDELFISPYAELKLKKWLRADFAYRFTNYPGRGAGHRGSIDLVFKDLEKFISKNKSRLGLNARLRGTHEFKEFNENQTYLRFRLGTKYNLPKTKLEPGLGIECFYHFNDQITYTFTDVEAHHRLNQYRIRFDLRYPVFKKHTIKAFYLFQKEINGPDTDHIIGLKFTYELPRLVQ
jgi:hypothetical protein